MNNPRAGAPERRPDSRPSIQPAIVSPPAPPGQSLSVALRPVGYRMIESVEIANFRSFEHLELSGFKRINIVVGDNGAGKTTLLEALFAVTGASAEIGARLRGWRGLETGNVNAQEVYDALFLPLFRNFNRNLVGSISIAGSDLDTRSLRFFFDPGEQIPLPLTESNAPTISTSLVPVVFEYKDTKGVVTKSVPQIQGNAIVVPPHQPRNFDSSFLAARMPYLAGENARWYSDLSKKGKEKRFFRALHSQFEDITSLSVEVELGIPVIFVKLSWMDRKIPINLVSDGLAKILTILLHVAHAERTATFIDELENGLHFSRHQKLWPQVLSTAREFNSQIFASTHSFEFIKAAIPTIEKNPHEFSLVRTFQKNGKGGATVLTGREALSLIEAGLEVRG
jgi:AAA domain, putative AbiEii toxin, Type IV TA system